MNSDHVQVIREALEYRKRVTMDFALITPKEVVEQLAPINAALAALDEDAGWEPVSEKFLLTHNTGLVDHPKLFVRWNADDESIIVGTDDGSFHHCPLPDHIRLCRKRQPARQEGDA